MVILTPKFPSITAPPVGAPPRDQTHPSSRPKTIRARRRRLLAIPSVRRARSTVLVARGHLRVTGPQWACVRDGRRPKRHKAAGRARRPRLRPLSVVADHVWPAWPDSAFASLTREDTPHTREDAARRRECSELLGPVRRACPATAHPRRTCCQTVISARSRRCASTCSCTCARAERQTWACERPF